MKKSDEGSHNEEVTELEHEEDMKGKKIMV
jgi:hypothetical protein